ncbi:C-type lectin domain family 12 member B-like [Mugil cephalus]|uniref:C-type lectin domain family 12 member B-like n=1 Tax=Mugil cephalus TaxID=48193 RepID=UPI001FB6AD16|nr:C-type lectin domain family 12 member B-like [Mugil cephalus]
MVKCSTNPSNCVLCGNTFPRLQRQYWDADIKILAMAEEEVVFRAKKRSKDKKVKQAACDEIKVDNEATFDTNGFLTDKKARRCEQLVCCLGIVFVILLMVMKAFCICHTVSSHDLSTVNLIENLTQAVAVAESKIKSLNDEKLNLSKELENLKEPIHNVSRAQWSIDAYCSSKHNNTRQCEPCQKGWLLNQTSCYAINDAKAEDRNTWEKAREDCRGRISDLVVVGDGAEKI